jgi:cephalosporin hydroxylase
MTAKEIVGGIEKLMVNPSERWPIISQTNLPIKIQMAQNPEEIEWFVDKLLTNRKSGEKQCALEIGLHQGGTHLVWKQIFQKVVSIDSDLNAIIRFMSILSDAGGSHMVFGNSRLPQTLAILKKAMPNLELDLLFIDGDHSREGVEADWMLYEPLVKKGGVVGFHDCGTAHPAVGAFLDDLRKGMWGTVPNIMELKKSTMGIAYYIKE